MKSFLESDLTYKETIGGKGVGGFSWLKAFKNITISSVFKSDDIFVKRTFDFNIDSTSINDGLIEFSHADNYE